MFAVGDNIKVACPETGAVFVARLLSAWAPLPAPNAAKKREVIAKAAQPIRDTQRFLGALLEAGVINLPRHPQFFTDGNRAKTSKRIKLYQYPIHFQAKPMPAFVLERVEEWLRTEFGKDYIESGCSSSGNWWVRLKYTPVVRTRKGAKKR